MSDTRIILLYRLLSLLGFPQPHLNQPGMPAIAWPATKTGIALPTDILEDGWDVVWTSDRLLVLGVFVAELNELSVYQRDPSHSPALGQRPPAPVSFPKPVPLAYHALYRLLGSLGFPQPHLNQPGMPAIAWPATKTGIVAPGEHVPEGWQVVCLGPEFNSLGDLALLWTRHQLRTSGSSATRRISSDEQRLLEMLLHQGLPTPDRNFKVVDDEGKFRGVVDFAWDEISGVEVRVAVELDGWHWHAGSDLADTLRLANDDKDVATMVHKETRSRVARDAAKRRVLSRRGWLVLQVTDDEVRRPGGAERVAEEIRATVARRFLDARQREVTNAPDLTMTAEQLN